MRDDSDERLLADLPRDVEALELFYRRHVGTVTRFLARRCRTPEDLADAVAETFTQLITAAARFDPARGSAQGWLLGIAAHCASSQARQGRRRVAVESAVSGRRLLDEDDYERLERQIDAARLAPALAEGLASLGGGDRELLELVEVDGLAPADAARVLRIRPAAARMRLTRARRRLRASLDSAVAAADGAGR